MVCLAPWQTKTGKESAVFFKYWKYDLGHLLFSVVFVRPSQRMKGMMDTYHYFSPGRISFS